MTKMNKIWVAVASLLYPKTSMSEFVSKSDIDAAVLNLFGETTTPVMIQKHLVSSEPRQADSSNPHRGGSQNRYLVRDHEGGYRLHKLVDNPQDAWDKTGPTHPEANQLDPEYTYLVSWYHDSYACS